jgi:hypothetical protein
MKRLIDFIVRMRLAIAFALALAAKLLELYW